MPWEPPSDTLATTQNHLAILNLCLFIYFYQGPFFNSIAWEKGINYELCQNACSSCKTISVCSLLMCNNVPVAQCFSVAQL